MPVATCKMCKSVCCTHINNKCPSNTGNASKVQSTITPRPVQINMSPARHEHAQCSGQRLTTTPLLQFNGCETPPFLLDPSLFCSCSSAVPNPYWLVPCVPTLWYQPARSRLTGDQTTSTRRKREKGVTMEITMLWMPNAVHT